MLGANVVSFHAERYRENFVRACGRVLADVGVEVHGSTVVLPDQRRVSTTTAPISIDTAEFRRLATEPATISEIQGLREQFAGRTLLLGVDRLDYTKGIIERLLAVEALLERRPDLRTKVAFLQVAVPSRDNVAEYRSLRAAVEGAHRPDQRQVHRAGLRCPRALPSSRRCLPGSLPPIMRSPT